MAGLRPGRIHRKHKRPWTRTSKKVAMRAYVKGVPDAKVRIFQMGMARPENCEIEADLVTSFACQIRDNAIEAARIMSNKHFEKTIGLENYYFKLRVFPHQVLREHSILMGAGADRLSKGMSHPFGRPVGRAARVKKGQTIMTLYTFKRFEPNAKEGLRRAAMKLQGNCRVVVSKKEDGHKA